MQVKLPFLAQSAWNAEAEKQDLIESVTLCHYVSGSEARTLSAGTVLAANTEDWSTAPQHLLPMLENAMPSEYPCINRNS